MVDRAIEQTEALIAKYEQIKTGLMHDLFTRGVTTDGRLRPHIEVEVPWTEVGKLAVDLTERRFDGKAVILIG